MLAIKLVKFGNTCLALNYLRHDCTAISCEVLGAATLVHNGPHSIFIL